MVPDDKVNLRVAIEDCVVTDPFSTSLQEGILFRVKTYAFDGTGYRREGSIAVGATSFIAIHETSRCAVIPKHER